MQRKNVKAIFALVSVLALFSLLFSFSFSVSAVEPLPDLSEAKSVYLWNAEYDKVIVSKSDGVIFPASMTKIMTGLVAIDLIGDRLDEKVTVTSEMLTGKKGTSMQLKVGETVTFRDLLYATVCGGFNDATGVLAVASAGSVGEFVKKMNEKAATLGAKSTHYTNPTGWHDDNMVTTLGDTVLIAKEAMKNELYVTVSSAPSYVIAKTNMSDKFTVNNRNGLIGSHYAYGYYNRRARGLIAGMTDEGGHCVATFFEDSGLTYLCIVMGATETEDTINSYAIANSLISHINYCYGAIDVIKAGSKVASAPVRLALSNTDGENYMLDCTVASNVSVLTPYDRNSLENIELRPYFFDDNLTAPVKKGDALGGVDIFVDGVLRGNATLYAAEDVEENKILSALDSAKRMLLGRAFIISFIVFVALFSAYFFLFELNALRKRNKKINFDRIY